MLFLSILMCSIFFNPIFSPASELSLHEMIVAIPDGDGGIGFDDLVYSRALHRVLVPAGHTGKLYLIDPSSLAMTSIGGFSSSPVFEKGHSIGISSADEGEGFIFVADHGRHELDALDPKTGSLVAQADLAGDADYVRYTGFNHEVWVTEPHHKQIEVFKFFAGHPMLKAELLIPVDDGPESLVVDHSHGVAYTNLGHQSAAINLESHGMAGEWPNGCGKSRGDAIDEKRGFLFVSCQEGKALVFHLHNDGKLLSVLATDPGPDVISYNARLAHLYLTSSVNATLSVIGVSAQGQLSILGQAPADQRSHCVVSDDQNNIWVCDPPHGQLLRYKDSL